MSQCEWPALNHGKEDLNVHVDTMDKSVKAMFIADTHLLGSREGHWFDKLRRFVFHKFSITYVLNIFLCNNVYIIEYPLKNDSYIVTGNGKCTEHSRL